MPSMDSTDQKAATLHGFDNAERAKYLGIIDQFRELGVNESISLPQLVVVGDQSSGKSSLLEGLTGLAFPVASDLCTRFATQIVLRRNDETTSRAKVTIIPGPATMRDKDSVAHLKSFERHVEGNQLEQEEFGKILNEASVHMGLPDIFPKSEAGNEHSEVVPQKRFSEDVLKVELMGPNQSHLSVVDVPGWFHYPTKHQTPEDKEIIRTLINDYIKERGTIILVVMDARNNLATQDVFGLAREVDPTRERTVGILTRLDVVESGNEKPVLSILRNQSDDLRHGWFAVRNRATQEIKDGITIAQRHEIERKFFQEKEPWKSLDSGRCGVDNLRKFLGQLLYEHVQREFPTLLKKVEELYARNQARLESLGPSCETTVEKRQFLTSMATLYQFKAKDALVGRYEADLPSDDTSKLRKHVLDRSDRFSNDLATKGHTFDFLTPSHTFRARGSDEPEELEDSGYVPNHPTFTTIQQAYKDSRGSELPGLVSPSVMETLFRQQSKNWDLLAHEYFEDVLEMAEAFRRQELKRSFIDAAMCARVEGRLSLVIEKTVEEGRRRLQEVLEDERAGILQTQNHYLADEINRTQQDRLVNRLQNIGFHDGSSTNRKLADVLQAAHLSLEEHAVYSIHDVLKAYYKLARKRFTDNVTMAVAERFLLGERGPVKAFAVEYITHMSEEELGAVAAEAFSISQQRTELRHRAERLQQALALARNL